MKINSTNHVEQKDEEEKSSSFCICSACDAFCDGKKFNCKHCQQEYITYFSCDWSLVLKGE